MSKDKQPSGHQSDLARKVAEKSARKLKSQRNASKKAWFGLGMMGLVGWSVAIPTLIGIFVGVWIDSTGNSRYSWTFMLLIAGIVIGCLNAWHWLNKEEKDLRDEEEQDRLEQEESVDPKGAKVEKEKDVNKKETGHD
ncbi:MAG: AtpZ/AtpI family protein [Bacillota bacterium]|nr:AtpZ/AtpI family protein [Bacillota bacterium]